MLTEFSSFELGAGIDILFKLGVSVAFIFYIIFAFVMVKQVNRMTDTLEVGFEGVLRSLAWIHLIFAVLAFAVAFIIL